MSCRDGSARHRLSAEEREGWRGGGDEKGDGVVVTGTLVAVRKKGHRDEGTSYDLFIQLTEGQRIKMRNGCRE